MDGTIFIACFGSVILSANSKNKPGCGGGGVGGQLLK